MGKKLEVVAPKNEPTMTFRWEFDAPRELVFDVFTSAEHMAKWLGPRRLKMEVAEMDARPGGTYRFVQTDAQGHRYAFHGEFREVVRPERIVRTFVFDPFPDASSVETLQLLEKNGRTVAITTAVYTSVEARDMHLKNGMEGGATESMERLDELLATLGKAA
jgi:uncharacterized protein YndB with AHSA1/START domain